MDDIIALSAKHDIEEEREGEQDRIESSREWHENIWQLFTILLSGRSKLCAKS